MLTLNVFYLRLSLAQMILQTYITQEVFGELLLPVFSGDKPCSMSSQKKSKF